MNIIDSLQNILQVINNNFQSVAEVIVIVILCFFVIIIFNIKYPGNGIRM